MQPLLLLLAYAALELALFRSYGRLDPVALTLVVLALAFSIAGVRASWPAKLEADVRRIPLLVLCGLIAFQLALLLFTPVETLFELDVPLGPFRAGAGVAAALLICYPLRLLPRGRFFALLAAYLWMGASLILASPRPNIDLWHFRQHACALLLRGENPYAADYPNIYTEERHIFGGFQPYAAQEMKNGRVLSYPYPPLTLVLDLPGYVAGDVRWSLLGAMSLAALLMRALVRRMTPAAINLAPQPPPSPSPIRRGGQVFPELVIVLLLLSPAGFSIIERGWIDPYLVLAAAGCGWALAANRSGWVQVATAGVLAAKQYGVFWLPALWATGRCRLRDLAFAMGLAFLTLVPFLLWDAQSMWQGLVAFHWQRPPQKQALALPAAIAAQTGYVLPGMLAPLAALAVGGAVAVLAARRLTTLFAGSATVFLVFFFLNKWAFLNYYWFVMALLSLAVVAACNQDGPPAEVGPDSRPALESRSTDHQER